MYFLWESTITVLGSAATLRPCIFAIWCKLNKFNVIDELWVEAFNFQGSLLWSITHTTWEYVSVPRNQTQTTKIEIQSSFSWSCVGRLDYMLNLAITDSCSVSCKLSNLHTIINSKHMQIGAARGPGLASLTTKQSTNLDCINKYFKAWGYH